MSTVTATNAASSSIQLDRRAIKQLARRFDRPGLIWLAQWAAFLSLSGIGLYYALGTWWAVPATIIYGTFLAVPAYALSHECAHGTAFRTRWINEAAFWLSSFIYMEEPLHRRYSHTRHHTYTWHEGLDSQMPFSTPLTFTGWLSEISGLAFFRYEFRQLFRCAAGRFGEDIRDFAPEAELPKLRRNAQVFLAVYAAIAAYMLITGHLWPIWFFVIPRIVGGVVMQLFTIIQHVEMQENSPNILESTRSFDTNWLGRFLYMNMNNHIEHHLYPMVPFHQLPDLGGAVADKTPQRDPGLISTNLEVLGVVVRRSLGRHTKARSIRQAPEMISPTPQNSV